MLLAFQGSWCSRGSTLKRPKCTPGSPSRVRVQPHSTPSPQRRSKQLRGRGLTRLQQARLSPTSHRMPVRIKFLIAFFRCFFPRFFSTPEPDPVLLYYPKKFRHVCRSRLILLKNLDISFFLHGNNSSIAEPDTVFLLLFRSDSV